MNSNSFELVRAALKGRKIVLVGGDRREDALRRLEGAFELAGVIHCRTRQADPSSRSFRFRLLEPGIALVVWAFGLTRTNHGRELRRLCQGIGIPFIATRHIPHPNRLVEEITSLNLLPALMRPWRMGGAS